MSFNSFSELQYIKDITTIKSYLKDRGIDLDELEITDIFSKNDKKFLFNNNIYRLRSFENRFTIYPDEEVNDDFLNITIYRMHSSLSISILNYSNGVFEYVNSISEYTGNICNSSCTYYICNKDELPNADIYNFLPNIVLFIITGKIYVKNCRVFSLENLHKYSSIYDFDYDVYNFEKLSYDEKKKHSTIEKVSDRSLFQIQLDRINQIKKENLTNSKFIV